jgi:hypothetical protein
MISASAELAAGATLGATRVSGIEDIPAGQRGAEWMNEYRQALAYASERA